MRVSIKKKNIDSVKKFFRKKIKTEILQSNFYFFKIFILIVLKTCVHGRREVEGSTTTKKKSENTEIVLPVGRRL
ncbi:uncharacterized protein CHAB577_0452 [Chlamydia abortus]|nr:hypothetical protein CEF07_02195 [Chlamydia abortus]AUS59873.1 uncharacterized protein CHAB577_0452 [Chlamydia abortus]